MAKLQAMTPPNNIWSIKEQVTTESELKNKKSHMISNTAFQFHELPIGEILMTTDKVWSQ
jgi:hypothetical protein